MALNQIQIISRQLSFKVLLSNTYNLEAIYIVYNRSKQACFKS